MPTIGIDPQLAMPAGREAGARDFCGRLLGLTEGAKAPALAAPFGNRLELMEPVW